MRVIAELMRLNKPIGIFLLLWPTLWGLWLANKGVPQFYMTLIFILGVIVTRSAGCVINDLLDQQFDKSVLRTKDRPLITGKISKKTAIILLIILLSFAFSLCLFLNFKSIELAFFAGLLLMIYPLMKRITYFPQVILGIAFAMGVPMAFAAVTNHIPRDAWIIFFAASLWPLIYDTQYAMVDLNDDLKIGVKSTAIFFGQHVNLLIYFLQILFLSLLILIGHLFQLNYFYDASLACVFLLFLYQSHLMKNRQWFNAFSNHGWVGLVILIGIIGGLS